MDKAEIAIGGFVVSGCEAPGIFQLVEAAFDHVAQGVNGGIDGQLDQAGGFVWLGSLPSRRSFPCLGE